MTRTTHPTERLEGTAPAVAALRAQVRRLAAFDTTAGSLVPTLLVQGETGTGKGLVARIVHDSGPRARGPFIPVNCAAIPETMLEAELFGFEAGAFTDAKRGKPGLFEAAAGGTLFLDEIDSLPLPLQSKLLTAMEGKRIRRLGSVAEHSVDVKLIAATQRDLARMVASQLFREDLYHRLAVVVLVLPPLRERGDDAVTLAQSFLERFAAGYGVAPKQLTARAQAWLRQFRWPGNVRELANLMERVTLLHTEREVDRRELERFVGPPGSLTPPGAEPAGAGAAPDDEASQIRAALERAEGNVVKAARLLGISRDTIRWRMRRHGIDRRPGEATARAPRVPSAPAPLTPPPRPEPASDRAPERTAALASPAAGEGDVLSSTLKWEQKTVAVVAVELTWPEADREGPAHFEPWTETARWERRVAEKLEGLGGVRLQRGPSLLLWGFGIPSALDQLPQRAVHGALAVRQLVAGLSSRELVPEIRIGVHLGALLVESGATDPAQHVLPVGDTLALPVRLLGEARHGELMASAEMARSVETSVALEPREMLGAARGGVAYRIVGVSRWRERGALGAQRPLSEFVGRGPELAALQELLAAARDGRGQAVGIMAEPGLGKSRLLHEFRLLLAREGVRYAEGRCLAHGSRTPYLPLREVLSEYCEIGDAEAPEAVAGKIRAALEDLGVDAEERVPYLLHLLGIAAPGDPVAGLDPQVLKTRTFEALRQLALNATREHPLVLAIEDAHWIDPTSEEFLVDLVERLAGAPALVVITYRPGYRPRWLDKSYASQIALRPLGGEASRELLRTALGDQTLAPRVEDEVLSRAEGNPFFLEELSRSVVEHAGHRAASSLPATIHAVLGARIDRLAPADRRLLQAAAVIGREVRLALLQDVTEIGDEALRDHLARLQSTEFLYEHRRALDAGYVFKHALTQSAAYETLPLESRRVLHLRVLEAIERMGDDGSLDWTERMARHAAAGGAWDKAVLYFWRAGSTAYSRGGKREAMQCYEDALAALDQLEESRETRERRFDLLLELGMTLYFAGEVPAAIERLRTAQELGRTLADARRAIHADTCLARVTASEGDYALGVETGERALAIADSLGDAALQIMARLTAARGYFSQGAYAQAATRLREAEEVLARWPASGDPPIGVSRVHLATATEAWLAISLAGVGDFAGAVARGNAAMATAAADGGDLENMWARYCLGQVHHARGDFDRAIALHGEALSLCGNAYELFPPRILAELACAHALSGRTAEAAPLLQRAVREAQAHVVASVQASVSVLLGMTHLLLGHPEEAQQAAAEALALARQRGERGNEGWSLLLLGDVTDARGGNDPESALDHYGQALACAERLGMRPLAARCRLALGAAHARGARAGEAREQLSVATAELESMGMAWWQKRAAALLAALS